MGYYDALPEPVREAMRACAWDIHIERRLPSGMDCTTLVAAIASIKTERDAVEFNAQHARSGGRWRPW
jgi:hypothetical protein